MTNGSVFPIDLSGSMTHELSASTAAAIDRSIATHVLAKAMTEDGTSTDPLAGGNVTLLITDGEDTESPEYVEAKTAVSEIIDTCKNPRNHTPEQWNTAYKNLGLIKSSGAESVFFEEGEIDAFKAFIEALPTEPDFTQPTALAALTAKHGEYAAIDNPIMWQHFGSVLNGLNEAGMQLQKGDLVDASGAPSAIMERAIHMGQTGTLFTVENWEGASKADLQATLRALPETALDNIGNRHQLLNTVGRDARTSQRDTGFAR